MQLSLHLKGCVPLVSIIVPQEFFILITHSHSGQDTKCNPLVLLTMMLSVANLWHQLLLHLMRPEE